MTSRIAQLKIPGLDGAQTEIIPPTGVPGGDIGFGDIISFGIGILFFIGIVLALIFLLWGGLSWITSGGDPDKLGKARSTIIYAILGILFIAFALFIVQTIGQMLGADFLANLAKPLVAPSCDPGEMC